MKLIFILLISISLYGDITRDMFELYQNEMYKDVCDKGFANFKHNKRNEEYVSLYALACLKADYIDRLSAPIAVLKYSAESRANSAYFSVILMQKKLLYHALIDGNELFSYTLPTTDYVLSKVFDFYVKLGKHDPQSFYLFKDQDDSKLAYKLYLSHEGRITKMIIEELYDTIVIKRHIYW